MVATNTSLQGEPTVTLLVEDNRDHAELVMRSLAEHRVVNKVVHLTDGEMALDYLLHRGSYADTTQYPRPCVVLLDLRLPKVDGLEVLKTIKMTSELQGLPVVILTTSESERDMARAYEHHANSYLVKPVDFQKFQELMNDLGFYWLSWNRSPWS